MNNIYSSAAIPLAHMDFEISSSSMIYLLIVMSLFVFGPLLFKKSIRMPKGLFLSFFVSYVLILIIITCLSSRLLPFKTILYPCITVVFPNLFIEYLIGELFGLWRIYNQTAIIYLVTFIMNTLYIFAIVRLILYIKHKISSKKPQDEQTV